MKDLNNFQLVEAVTGLGVITLSALAFIFWLPGFLEYIEFIVYWDFVFSLVFVITLCMHFLTFCINGGR